MQPERSTADHAQHGRKAGRTAPGTPCRQQLTAGPSTATAPHVARTAVDVAESDAAVTIGGVVEMSRSPRGTTPAPSPRCAGGLPPALPGLDPPRLGGRG